MQTHNHADAPLSKSSTDHSFEIKNIPRPHNACWLYQQQDVIDTRGTVLVTVSPKVPPTPYEPTITFFFSKHLPEGGPVMLVFIETLGLKCTEQHAQKNNQVCRADARKGLHMKTYPQK